MGHKQRPNVSDFSVAIAICSSHHWCELYYAELLILAA